MLFENIKRVFKKPDEEKEAKRKEEINEFGLEKGDLPAMILSAYLVIIPVALLVLGLIALVAFLFIN